MTIQDIYELAIKMGTEADLRGKAKVQKVLKRVKEQYEKLDKDKKKEFDKEKLTNPYPDSRILFQPAKKIKAIKRIMVGVDMETPELMLAKQMGDIDLVIAHHPEGKALADLSEVMHLQAEVLHQYGIPINIAESLLHKRISEVARGVNPVNHQRPVDAARLLNMPYMNVHTPTDNLAADYLDKVFKKKKPEYVGDVLKILKEIPEYKKAVELGAGPRLFTGDENKRCGKIALTEITGGTEGSKEIYDKLANAGVGTILAMHQSEDHRKAAEEAHINVVIAGHMSSDSLGINLFLDALEKRGVKVVPMSGLIRVKRK